MWNIVKKGYWVRFLLSFSFVIGLHLAGIVGKLPLMAQTAPAAQGQVLEDYLNSANTPTIQMLAGCLPQHLQIAQATRYTVISSASVLAADNTPSTFYYLQVHYEPQREGQILPYDWFTLLEVNSQNQCISHIPQSSFVRLDQFVPFETAVQFAVARFSYYRDYQPQAYQELVNFYATGRAFLEGRAERPEDNASGCQLFAEDAAALQQLGVQIAQTCTVMQ